MTIMTQNQQESNTSFCGKTWELSPYELARQPQEVIMDNSEIAVSPRSLYSEFNCPICLDMLKSTYTTKECLHRFCQECIITALRSGNKECPTCRKKLISKRSLRPDPNFDLLIAKIFPNRDEIDALQDPMHYLTHHHFMNNIETTLRMQTLNRGRSTKKPANNDYDNNRRIKSQPIGIANGNHHSEENAINLNIQEIELIIKPLPQVERKDPSLNKTRFMKTTTAATINHIAKYLKIRYAFESEEDNKNNSGPTESAENGIESNETFPFTLYIAAGPGQYNPLQGCLTLAQVDEQYWKINKPIELFYAYKVNPTS